MGFVEFLTQIYPRMSWKGGKIMEYKKPEIVAQNSPEGVFSAGCATSTHTFNCNACELKC